LHAAGEEKQTNGSEFYADSECIEVAIANRKAGRYVTAEEIDK